MPSSLVTAVLVAVMAVALTGCSNLPPLIQKNGNTYSLILPSGQQMMDALIYHEDARIPMAGDTVIVESKAGGGVRFLYPNRSYVDIDGWSSLHLLSVTPDGQKTIALFRGDHNGEKGAEMLAVIERTRVQSIQVASAEDEYLVNRIQGNQIELVQSAGLDPKIRMLNLGSGTLSAPYKRMLAQKRETDSQATVQNIGAGNRNRGSNSRTNTARPARNDGLIDISDSTISVKSQIPSGYQRAAPQKIDLR